MITCAVCTHGIKYSDNLFFIVRIQLCVCVMCMHIFFHICSIVSQSFTLHSFSLASSLQRSTLFQQVCQASAMVSHFRARGIGDFCWSFQGSIFTTQFTKNSRVEKSRSESSNLTIKHLANLNCMKC